MKTSWTKLAVIGLLSVSSLGCVSQQRYDELNTLYRRSQEQVSDLQSKLEEANSRIKSLQEAQRRGPDVDPDTIAKLQQAIAERDRLSKALADAQAQLRDSAKVPDVVMLEPEIDKALKDLVASDPNLMSYDPALGVIRFKSDLTFPSGSTEVADNAAASLNKLAEILKRPVAEKYEVRVVGHTDNVKIGKPDTKAKHPTNWHLSVHRSIAVKDVLEKAGVEDVRIEVAGYGEFRPLVPNGP